jgi:hypothetical protein
LVNPNLDTPPPSFDAPLELLRRHPKRRYNHVKTKPPELLIAPSVNPTGEPEGATRQWPTFNEDIEIEKGED